MKKLVFIFITAMIFSSCTAVKFEDPQPAGVPLLSEFPEKMQGIFTSEDDDTLTINQRSFRYFNGKEVNVAANLDTTNTVVLKRAKNTYILNIKEEQGWDVIPLKITRNRITAQYANLNSRTEPLILELRKTAPVEKVMDEDGKFSYYLIKPSEKEFQKLLNKGLFSEKTVFRRIR